MSEKITYGEMCDVIATDWNKEEPPVKFTGEQIWGFPLIKQFPALYVPLLYDAAKTGDLVGLLLHDPTCAKMFLDGVKNEA